MRGTQHRKRPLPVPTGFGGFGGLRYVQTRHHTKAYPRPANTGGRRRRCCRGALAARATPECSKRERGPQHSSSMPRRALTNHKQGANQGAAVGACGSQQMNGCSAGAMPGAQCQHSTRLAASPNLVGPHALHCQCVIVLCQASSPEQRRCAAALLRRSLWPPPGSYNVCGLLSRPTRFNTHFVGGCRGQSLCRDPGPPWTSVSAGEASAMAELMRGGEMRQVSQTCRAYQFASASQHSTDGSVYKGQPCAHCRAVAGGLTRADAAAAASAAACPSPPSFLPPPSPQRVADTWACAANATTLLQFAVPRPAAVSPACPLLTRCVLCVCVCDKRRCAEGQGRQPAQGMAACCWDIRFSCRGERLPALSRRRQQQR